MDLIYGWVMQVVIFILMGTILELLIPNNMMKKYINIVIGLLLLVILSQPILYLLSIDITTELEKIEQTITRDTNTLVKTNNIIENEKREIEQTKDAYIWNEVKLQLIGEANPLLLKHHSIHIRDISQIVDNDDKLTGVIVTVSEENEVKTTEGSVIKPVIIDSEKEDTVTQPDKRMEQVKSTLEQVWGLSEDNIQIVWEGGAS